MIHWYVMQSKPRQEAFLCEQLFTHKIEAYLPSIRLKPANPRSKKEQPFFPGYLFIHVDLEKFSLSDLRWMPGTIGIVCYGGEPAYVADKVIQAIQEHIDATRRGYDDLFKPGDAVLIKDGLFADYKAIFDCRLSGHDRVRVLLELLQGQRMRLELSTGQLQALTQ
jgi:transcription elongation factor/antiterminator RfaH